jgi:hypothetical protein
VRRQLLPALNERRGTLETTFRRPLLLVLPAGFNAEAWTYASDLWTVRSLVGELPTHDAATTITATGTPARPNPTRLRAETAR